MLDKFLASLASIVAAKVAEELVRRLPEIVDAVSRVVPDLCERIADGVLERLLDKFPPFRRLGL